MKAIENSIRMDMELFARKVKELAPQNSNYVGLSNYKVVDYIHVDGARVRTNSNNLYNSINMVETLRTNNRTIYQVVVVGDVPYYEQAVLSPEIEVAFHYGRTEYGSVRYSNSIVTRKTNRNYLYYIKGEVEMRALISKWNNQTFTTTEKIGDYK